MPSPLPVQIVEPDLAIAKMMVTAFHKIGKQVQIFQTVDELLACSCDGCLAFIKDEPQIQLRDVIQMLAEARIWCPVVLYAKSPDSGRVVEAMKVGIHNYISIPIEPGVLEQLTSEAEASQEDRQSLGEAQATAQEMIDKLTAREKDVLQLLAFGQANKSIARLLGISPRTVEIHRANGMRKLEAEHPCTVARTFIQANAPCVVDDLLECPVIVDEYIEN